MTKTTRDQLFTALAKLECSAELGDLSNIGIADYDAFKHFVASVKEELDADEKELRDLQSLAQDMKSLLSACSALLQQSGVKMAANAGNLLRFGIKNVQQLELFLGEITRVLGA